MPNAVPGPGLPWPVFFFFFSCDALQRVCFPFATVLTFMSRQCPVSSSRTQKGRRRELPASRASS